MAGQDIKLEFDGISIQSTAEGKISVIDAIYAVTGSNRSESLWKKLASDYPEVLNYCEAYSFQHGGKKLVVGAEGWEKIFLLLTEYLDYEL